jgi:hypothetical protein
VSSVIRGQDPGPTSTTCTIVTISFEVVTSIMDAGRLSSEDIRPLLVLLRSEQSAE